MHASILFFGAVANALATTHHFGTAIGGALDSTHAHSATASPTPTAGVRIQDVADGPLTINIHNSGTQDYSVTYGSNSGVPSPISGTQPTAIAAGADMQFLAPAGWAGRIIIGGDYNVDGSKIESSLDGQPNIDVSYVDGYSVPIVCECDDGAGIITGCNKELYDLGSCPNQNGATCENPARSMNDGPADPFFAPCQGGAYTYPNDNGADKGCNVDTINCCVGSACPPNPNQPQ